MSSTLQVSVTLCRPLMVFLSALSVTLCLSKFRKTIKRISDCHGQAIKNVFISLYNTKEEPVYDSNEFRLSVCTFMFIIKLQLVFLNAAYVFSSDTCVSQESSQHLVSLHKHAFWGKCCFTLLGTNQVISEFVLIHGVKWYIHDKIWTQ